MKTILLKRVAQNAKGVFGVLISDNIPFAVTLERPWLENQRSISCIPAGIYTCKRVNSPKFGDTFEVTSVEDRTHILLHKGNLAIDSEGCILVAEEFGKLGASAAILDSAHGFTELMSMLKGINEFQLVIQWDTN